MLTAQLFVYKKFVFVYKWIISDPYADFVLLYFAW